MNVFKKSSQKTIQRLFVWAVLGAWIVSVLNFIIYIVQQYQYDPNPSSYLVVSFYTLLMPLLIVTSLYFSKRKRNPTLENTFNLLVVVTAINSFLIAMFTAFSMILMPFATNGEPGGETIYAVATYVPMVITLASIIYAVLKLRRSSDW
jgi:glucan phosphoethanolaminetransferase (alkaline phosphatase superfamily)